MNYPPSYINTLVFINLLWTDCLVWKNKRKLGFDVFLEPGNWYKTSTNQVKIDQNMLLTAKQSKTRIHNIINANRKGTFTYTFSLLQLIIAMKIFQKLCHKFIHRGQGTIMHALVINKTKIYSKSVFSRYWENTFYNFLS